MSMGAVLSLAYTPLRHPDVEAVIAMAPGLKTVLEEQKFKVFLAKILGSAVPTLTLESGVDPETLSRNPEVAEEFLNDPLNHFFVTTSWGKTMLETVDLVYELAPQFPLPLLLMHGTEDSLAYPRGSRMYAELVPQDKVILKMWDGFKHDLVTDPQSEEVFQTILEWLDKHEPQAIDL
jgi:lysophospholipase